MLLLVCCGWAQSVIAQTTNPEAVSALLDRVGGNGTSGRFVTIVDASLSTGGKDVFVITSESGKPCIKGNNISAVTTGINWYLNHYAHVNIAWNNLTTDLSTVDLPVPTQEEKHNCSVDYRYYLNYCTFSYSMSVWTWERWQKEIDWMALHGINMPLQIIGLDVVWKNLLTQELGYTSAEANDFIAGPCFQAWWGMNNLQGWGGPNPDWWYTRQEKLAKQILARERELGMKPVLPGYAGMAPSNITEKTSIEANNQGEWCSFVRPYILDPNSEGFKKVSELYYKHLENIMGTSEYYSIDPFHEGANTSGIDVPSAYKNLAQAMYKAQPSAKWVVQFWQWSGAQYNILSQIEKGKLIVLDLYSESVPNFSSYGEHESVYCNLPNFGGRTGLFGRLNKTLSEFYNYKKNYPHINGVGATPEAIEQVPVLYDALFELPWRTSAPDAKEWLADYTKARYGADNADVQAAWEKIRNSALNCPTGLQGPHEAVLCARPNLNVGAVSTWGGTEIFYNAQDVVDAAYKMLQAKGSLTGQNFSYDLTDFTRQAFTDYGYYLLKAINEAVNSNNKDSYAKRRDAYLQLILDLDELLNTNKSFMLGRWTNLARGIANETSGTTENDKQWLELNNARTLITTWGGEAQSEWGGLRDYSYREWGGMLKDFYYKRWKAFFDNRDKGTALPNWYNNDYTWAHDASLSYSDTPVGSTSEVAARLFGKYFISTNLTDGTPFYLYRYMNNDLSKTLIENALRGENYTCSIQLPNDVDATLGVDFNNDGSIADDEKVTGNSIAIPASVVCGKVKALLTLSDGTEVKFSIVLKDEITSPRTVSIKSADETQGAVAINGTTDKSVTNKEEVTLIATPSPGYDFLNWTDANDNIVSADNPYTYYGAQAADFTAHFIVNKWGSPKENLSEHETVANYGQYVTSLSASQNGGEEKEIYATQACPESLFQTTGILKAAVGSKLVLHWKSAGGLNYCNLSAYADWNNDGEFNENDELVAVVGEKSTSGNNQLNDYTLNVLLPYTTPQELTHIRLRFDGAWENGYNAQGAMPAKHETTRFVYDIPVQVIGYAETVCTVTVKSSDKDKGTVDANGQPETFTYKVGEDIVLRCYPSTGYKIDYWTDQYGRKVPESWVNGNSIRFKASESGTYTAFFSKDLGNELAIGDWKFNYELYGNYAVLTNATVASNSLTIPAKTSEGLHIIGLKANALAGQKGLTSVSLPSSVVALGSANIISEYAYNGAGIENDIIQLGETLEDNSDWSIHVDVSNSGASFNQWGSGILATGNNALGDDYSKGFQFYQSVGGELILKTGNNSEMHTFNCTKNSSSYHIELIHTAQNNISVKVSAANATETHTLSNHSLNAISQLCTAIPSGINISEILVVSPNKKLAYHNLVGDIVGEQKENNSISLGQALSNNSDWGLSFSVENDGTSYNEWGSSLLATGSSPLESGYDKGFQFYLQKSGNLILKRGYNEDTFTVTSGEESFKVSINHTADGVFAVTVDNGKKSETKTFENYELSNLTTFSNALPVGVNIKGLTVVNPSVDPAPFRGCSALSGISVDAANPVYSAKDNVLFSNNGTALVAYPEGRMSHSYVLPTQVTTIKDGAFTSAPELDRLICNSSTPASASSATISSAGFYVQVPTSAATAYRDAWKAPIVVSLASDATLSSTETALINDNDAVDFQYNEGVTGDAPSLQKTNAVWLTLSLEAGKYAAVCFPSVPTRVSVDGVSVSETSAEALTLFAWNGESFVRATSPTAGAYLLSVPEEWSGKQLTIRFANTSDPSTSVEGFFGNTSTKKLTTAKAYYAYNPTTNLFNLQSADESADEKVTTITPLTATLIAKDGAESVVGGPGYVGSIAIKSPALWGTFFTDKSFVMPTGLTGYIVDGVANEKLQLIETYQAGSVVPPSVAMLVYGDLGEYYCFEPKDNNVSAAPSTNYLKGTTTDKMIENEAGHVYYQLTYGTVDGNRKFGFFFGAENGAPFVNKAHKAYLDLTAEMAEMIQGFALPLDFTTNIDSIKKTDANDLDVYNLNGMKLIVHSLNNLSKGVYIVNGKKVIVK